MKLDLFNATKAAQVHRLVLLGGADPNAPNKHGEWPLQNAIERDAPIEVLAELLNRGAWGDGTDPVNRAPLYLAARESRLSMVQLLLERGANPDGQKCALSPLHAAAFGNDFAIVDLLLAHKADPNVRGATGATPLFAARTKLMAQHLMNAGASPFVRDNNGDNAATWWRANNHLDALEATPPVRPRLRIVGGNG